MICLLLGWPCWILTNCRSSPKIPAGQLSQISYVIPWEPKTIKKPCTNHDGKVHYVWVSGGNWTSLPPEATTHHDNSHDRLILGVLVLNVYLVNEFVLNVFMSKLFIFIVNVFVILAPREE